MINTLSRYWYTYERFIEPYLLELFNHKFYLLAAIINKLNTIPMWSVRS